MEHALKYITFYVEKHIAHLAMCYNPMLVRDKPLEAPKFVKLVYIIPGHDMFFASPGMIFALTLLHIVISAYNNNALASIDIISCID